VSARHCIHTGVSLPECSCLSCNREKVRRYAPGLIADSRDRGRSKAPARRLAAGAKR
jgi:hypothetical protein